MLGRSHAMTGLIFGVGEAAALDHAPLIVRLLVIPVAGGSALLPDIDKPGSRVARSLGPVTGWIARGVAGLAVVVYDATRTELDPVHCDGGHRQLTHTMPSCVGFGAITYVAERVHPALGVAVLTLLCGLLARGFRSIGVGFTVVGAVVSWWVITHAQSWWWVWPVSVTAGSFMHILGDSVTRSGTPMWWPLLRHGKRWGRVHTRATFRTGDHFETEVLTPVLAGALALSAGFTVGLPQAVYHAVAR